MEHLHHILLVNNDPIHNLFSQIVLEDANVCDLLSVCYSVPEALELLHNSCSGTGLSFPDLILLDMNLPDNESLLFLEVYHQLNYHITQPTNISLLTPGSNYTHAEEAQRYGAVAGFIAKPLSLTNLYNMLARSFSYNLGKQF
ncbi:response regulator [Pontibacter qinzhouensis]|uniref:Response regulator n=1 Tax=Pontibacter qinzhouensis TaxID=2603253 RepID=A0A5C8KEZ6_9BACT|nr:response regulator [Pontibacter qinzhouensis]TXK52100.1 response regulator [Pontibacter qinzhouensis]